MQQQQMGMMGGGEENYGIEEGSSPYDEYENPYDEYEEDGNVDETEKSELKNIFLKAFDNFLNEE